ncbi:hypothetical protein [Gluconobacter wancherniae]|uniref:hypothetical protein n=1 Tax=Gluconobacter wancherniae TaxID=1307955 RepID=UPI001B8B6E82|nr:hypothetical protein [Gluconobacter wancherniae]MBS1095956.1 hypothetical protein [Gluconobacter wancherniae]
MSAFEFIDLNAHHMTAFYFAIVIKNALIVFPKRNPARTADKRRIRQLFRIEDDGGQLAFQTAQFFLSTGSDRVIDINEEASFTLTSTRRKKPLGLKIKH